MAIVYFEDEHVSRLDPVALAKPAYTIHCGGTWLRRLLEEFGPPQVRVRPHLRAAFAVAQPPTPSAAELVLWVNARLVPTVDALHQLRALVSQQRPGLVQSGSVTAAALLPAQVSFGGKNGESPSNGDFAALKLPRIEAKLPLFEYPHDIVRHHLAQIGNTLAHLLSLGGYTEVAEGVFAGPGASLGKHVATDTQRGPILLEAGATVGPGAYMAGPVWLGRSARVIAHASIKDGVSIGDYSKVGGEVDASIFESYSNKQHHGFLGHSYVGHWVNIGAGTSNSDLKNTYGSVNMEYRGQKVSTDMQFLGTIIGDYAKTAINTSIFTGKTIGVCSMVYGFVTANVPSFVNYARSLGQVTEAAIEPLAATQRRMFQRRGRVQQPSDIQLLEAMFELTAHERAALGEDLLEGPLSL